LCPACVLVFWFLWFWLLASGSVDLAVFGLGTETLPLLLVAIRLSKVSSGPASRLMALAAHRHGKFRTQTQGR